MLVCFAPSISTKNAQLVDNSKRTIILCSMTLSESRGLDDSSREIGNCVGPARAAPASVPTEQAPNQPVA